MNRIAVVALSVAAVLGTTGGVTLASLQHEPTKPSAHGPSGTPSPTPSATPSTSAPTTAVTQTPPPTKPVDNPLLYATDTAIHDGSLTIPVNGPHHVVDIARYAEGYVVAEPKSSQEALFDLWTIQRDGTAKDFASVAGDNWDLNVEGTRLVGADGENGMTTVWDLGDGHVVATWPKSSDATGTAGFAGSQVYVSQFTGNSDNSVFRWNPDAGTKVKEKFPAPDQMALSPGGSYLSGAVGPDGASGASDTCLLVRSTYLKKHVTEWQSCDYRTLTDVTSFSPDGTRLIAVPAKTDGFGPGELDIIDASDGPKKLVGSFATPDWTLGATWDTDDALYVYGSNNDDPGQAKGGWVDRCDLQGHCTRVVTTKQKIVLAAIR